MKKVFFGSIIIVILLALGGIFFIKHRLSEREAARVAAQNQKAEEVKITLIEGWTSQDIAAYLESKGLFSKKSFLDAQKQFSVTDYPLVGTKPKGSSLEGFLFPDTYQVLKDTTSETVLDKLLSTFEQRFGQASKNVPQTDGYYQIPGFEDITIGARKATGLTLFELVTLASIVEKETGRDVSKSGSSQKARLDEERRTVAGIFYNRLHIGKALESDATINYVTGKDDPTPSGDDLATKSAYNTYQNPGLPPGPISNPSLSSLQAVLNPIKTDYFYFLHKQPSGEVVYSKTFEEHRQKKFEFLK
jgi:UPF0755 protein